MEPRTQKFPGSIPRRTFDGGFVHHVAMGPMLLSDSEEDQGS
jgi:hypothetical protein